MRRITHTNDNGRKYAYIMPDNVADSEVESGIMVGPVDVVDVLDYPEEIRTKLHNELFNRGIMNYDDARKKPGQIQAAIQAALRMDVAIIQDAFFNYEREVIDL